MLIVKRAGDFMQIFEANESQKKSLFVNFMSLSTNEKKIVTFTLFRQALRYR